MSTNGIGKTEENWITELGEEAISRLGLRKGLTTLIKTAKALEKEHAGEELPAAPADFRYQTGLKVLEYKDLFLSTLRFPAKIRMYVLEHFPGVVSSLVKTTGELKTEREALAKSEAGRTKAESMLAREKELRAEAKEKTEETRRLLSEEREARRELRDTVRKLEKENAPLKALETGKAALFIATNGGGLGHLSCSLSVARRMKKLDPSMTIVFLTTSLALQVVHREGFVAYALPSPMIATEVPSGEWNRLLEKLLGRLFEMYRFSLCVFDGAAPYASILRTVEGKEDLLRVWLRYYRAKTDEIHEKQRELEQHFDLILMPADSGEYVEEADERHIPMNSLVYLDRDELLPRETVRRIFSIPEENKAVYIQLGAGNINDIHSDLSRIVRALKSIPNVSILLGESIIGDPLDVADPAVTIVRDYPNSRYFGGFDLVITACGYNSFHEVLFHRIPALFLPNTETRTDDQVRRAGEAAKAGFGRMAVDISDETELKRMITELLGLPAGQSEAAAASLLPENGAWEAARILTDRIGEQGEEQSTDED